MDTRRLITAVLVTILVVFGFQFATNWFAKQMGWDLTRRPPATQPAAPTTGPATATSTAAATTGAAPATQGAVVSAAAHPAVRVAAATQPTSTVVRLGSAQRNDPTYRLAMEIVPRGAAIERVVLNEFTRAVESKEPYVFQTPLVTKPDESRSLATRAVVVDGTRVELDDVPWTLESSDANRATFSLTLEGDAGPLLRLTKTYEIFDRNAPGAGYEILVRHGLEN